MLKQFWNDEAGVILSAELVFVLTLLVIGLVVGLSELQHAVVQELNDAGDAIGNLNQSYYFTGFSKLKFRGRRAAAITYGSAFGDIVDECDNNQCAIACDLPSAEGAKNCQQSGGTGTCQQIEGLPARNNVRGQ